MSRIDLASHAAYTVNLQEMRKEILRLFDAGDEWNFQVSAEGFLGIEHFFFQFYLNHVQKTGQNQFIGIATEEMPILKSLEQMEMLGCGVKLLPVGMNGQIDLEKLKAAIGPKTALVSVSVLCAMTGVMLPLAEIIQICRKKGVKVHVNATHAVGSWGVSLKEWDVDYLTFDGSSSGGLFSKEPWINSESSTSGLLEEIQEKVKGQEQFAMESARMRYLFEEELKRAISDCVVIGQDVERAPHLFAVAFPGLMSEALMYALHQQGVEVSIGGGRFQTLREILQKWGYSDDVACSAVSFSFSHILQEEDLAEALDQVVRAVRNLKKMSVALE